MSLTEPAEVFDAGRFAQFALELHDAAGVDETLEAVVQFALHAADCTHAGVALIARGGRAEVGAVTDPVVETLYRFQIDAGEGPLLTALSGRTVTVHDVATDDRWPCWQPAAVNAGIGSALHVPMKVNGQTTGVLSLYHAEPNAFTVDDEAIAHILARHASVAVATARHEVDLAQAVDARKLVGQAMGILMERFDLDGDQAFAVLRRYSQDTNTKLRDVAQQLIETRKLPR
ncbi:GAF and ANTAR domain-containing protein [Kribbella sp. VKM Ac-2566]|uniref:GAF and ANTAR domain-containing protein n=1 Tax=Kribbella sp. VKM Ac-2566 TaxID=2512218 RepID=UPI00106376EA|nr:GAF and ANTAR domain-containing protein [Kribbella sp. VKM Ac-2566]TDW79594.1 GAF domain-containing protein [Kribbella sp. VKM Ac-2566]